MSRHRWKPKPCPFNLHNKARVGAPDLRRSETVANFGRDQWAFWVIVSAVFPNKMIISGRFQSPDQFRFVQTDLWSFRSDAELMDRAG
jgi:hypothetical protein